MYSTVYWILKYIFVSAKSEIWMKIDTEYQFRCYHISYSLRNAINATDCLKQSLMSSLLDNGSVTLSYQTDCELSCQCEQDTNSLATPHLHSAFAIEPKT